MKTLPKIVQRYAVLSFTLLFSFFIFSKNLFAASAYISQATGIIKEQNFLISVYVESSTSEPAIAAADIKITYPTTVNVVTINNGDFDSYLDKNYDPNTRTISINALNNAGNYKTGKVKLASIKFETTANSGEVQLTITPESGIIGEGGEQLLTETINGTYTIDIEDTTATTPTTETPTGTESTGTGAPAATTDQTDVPETGIVSNTLTFLALSVGLIGLGFLMLSKSKPKLNRA